MNPMLRVALRKHNGLRQQLDNVLLGDDGDVWEAQLKNFLAQRPCWVKKVAKKAKEVVKTFLRALGITFELSATDGKQSMDEAKKVFTSGVDGDIVNWGPDGEETRSATKVEVFELAQSGKFSEFYGPYADKPYWTWKQIVNTVRDHSDKLIKTGSANFFLMKKGNEFFVACVYWNGVGWRVHVFHFGHGYVWSGDGGRRLFVPQL
jgi:hypothetical protein